MNSSVARDEGRISKVSNNVLRCGNKSDLPAEQGGAVLRLTAD